MKANTKSLFGQIRPQHVSRLRSFVLGITVVTVSQQIVIYGHPSTDRSKHRDVCSQLDSEMTTILPQGLDGRASRPGGDAQTQLIKHLIFERTQLNVAKCLQEIDLLQALLGYDVGANRNRLVAALSGCERGSNECDEKTAQYVIALYNNGEHQVLSALLKIATHSDGALSEALGVFYRERLLNSPATLLRSLALMSPAGRQQACFLAGTGDGSGTDKADSNKISDSLRIIGSKLSTECMSAFGRGEETVK